MLKIIRRLSSKPLSSSLPSVVVCADVVVVACSFVVVVVVVDVIVRLVVIVVSAKWKKVRFDDGVYGLSLEGDLEVFGHNNLVHTFYVHIIKKGERLFVDCDGHFETGSRDNYGLTSCFSTIVFHCVVKYVACAISSVKSKQNK